MIYENKLRNSPPPGLGTHPPWVPVPTFAAAAFLRVHTKTLLEWAKEGVGPQPVDRDTFTCNQIYWQPGRLLEWWELHALGETRGFQRICCEWMKEIGFLMADSGIKWRVPPRPMGRHKRRRRRTSRKAPLRLRN